MVDVITYPVHGHGQMMTILLLILRKEMSKPETSSGSFIYSCVCGTRSRKIWNIGFAPDHYELND